MSLIGIDPEVNGVQKGKAYRAMDVQTVSFGLHHRAGLGPISADTVAQWIVDGVDWDQIAEGVIPVIETIDPTEEGRERRLREVQKIYMTKNKLTIDAKVTA